MSLECPVCSKTIMVPDAPHFRSAPLDKPSSMSPGKPAEKTADAPAAPPAGTRQYKVVSLGDRTVFPAELNVAVLEAKINELATQGWTLKEVRPVRWPNWLNSSQEETLVFFEKKA
jgi:hypothetical protein